ncbi:hypothetical protein MRX96_014921 [Rhipicephalus microplus]
MIEKPAASAERHVLAHIVCGAGQRRASKKHPTDSKVSAGQEQYHAFTAVPQIGRQVSCGASESRIFHQESARRSMSANLLLWNVYSTEKIRFVQKETAR